MRENKNVLGGQQGPIQRALPQNTHKAQCTDEKDTLQHGLFEETQTPEISQLLPLGDLGSCFLWL